MHAPLEALRSSVGRLRKIVVEGLHDDAAARRAVHAAAGAVTRVGAI